MYDMTERAVTRSHKAGFVIPSQNEWIKAAYFDPNGGGKYSYWKYPTNPGEFETEDEAASAPKVDDARPDDRRRHQRLDPAAGDLPRLRNAGPDLVPGGRRSRSLRERQPLRDRPDHLRHAYQGSLSTVGQAKTPSPWGTLDQGGNAVEWTDTITPPPFGASGHRVWRRLHGGIANAPVYQLWLSAIGPQPQDNAFFTATYPWLGIRIGALGNLKVAKR